MYYLVPHVEDVLEVGAHAVVLNGEEHGVQDDAQRHHKVEHRVVDDLEQHVLTVRGNVQSMLVYPTSL